jgi:hypothetical protein
VTQQQGYVAVSADTEGFDRLMALSPAIREQVRQAIDQRAKTLRNGVAASILAGGVRATFDIQGDDPPVLFIREIVPVQKAPSTGPQ